MGGRHRTPGSVESRATRFPEEAREWKRKARAPPSPGLDQQVTGPTAVVKWKLA